MSTFNRGLDDAFVAAFNEEYDKGGWLRRLLDDKDIFLAIRENYVNFYYRGCSLLRLDLRNGAMIGEVHYKYLLRVNSDNPYIKVANGRPNLPEDTKRLFHRDYDDIKALKRAAEPYAGDEKTGVHDILLANPNIFDVEIAFGNDGKAPRMDFVAIRDEGANSRVIFFEAKHFDNHTALRAKSDIRPEVVEQMERYSIFLKENDDAVRKSFHRVCCNLTSLRGVAKRHPERHAMLEGIADGSRQLFVDENPVLIVFGFDADQRDGLNWQPHRKKLDIMLPGKVLFKGKSQGFVRGISL